MGQDLFKYLPLEIILDILTRLPARTVLSYKCVCKPWLDLIITPEFVKSHLSKSVPGLAVTLEGEHSKPYKVVEFVDEDLDCHLNTVFDFDLPFHVPVHSSANGLLFLCELVFNPLDMYICNPYTREYIELPSPPLTLLVSWTFGFGVSKMSGQYKVVGIFLTRRLLTQMESDYHQFECQVYTVGSGPWRRISLVTPVYYNADVLGAFLNGNLHWLASMGSSVQISCLDLETELFSIFSPPLVGPNIHRTLSVLRDCLCVCDNPSLFDCRINIWLMKEYGDEKSWTKEFIIRKASFSDFLGFLCPIKAFKDGDILMKFKSRKLLYYSSKTKTIREVDLSGLDRNIFCSTTSYAPSFLPLKAFEMENVSSF